MRAAGASRRVAVTGVGVVSVCGLGAEAFWRGLFLPPPTGPVLRVADWDPSPWLTPQQARHTDRFAQFSLAAADLALTDAELDPAGLDLDRCGVQVGTGIGGVATFETAVRTLDARGPGRVSPFTAPMIMPNAGSAVVSLRWGFRGPAETITTACAAGTHSVAAGARLVAWGLCDVVLAGGADASLVGSTVAGFTNAGAMSRSGISRPFDRGRDGFVAAEGAALLVLEPLEDARARGARVYCVVEGAASTSDAFHMTAPAPQGRGAQSCMHRALHDAQRRPDEVSHVNAHGTSTPLNDAAEAAAVAAVFGPKGVAVTSIKGVTGHALGAAGALEAAAVCLSFQRATIPPTVGFAEPDDDTAVVDVVDRARPLGDGVVLSNSFGFGGHNGTLVFGPA